MSVSTPAAGADATGASAGLASAEGGGTAATDDAAGAAGAVSGGSNNANDAVDGGGILNCPVPVDLPGEADNAAGGSEGGSKGASVGGGSDGGGKGTSGAVSRRAAAVAHSGLLGTTAGTMDVSEGRLSNRSTIRVKYSALSGVKDARRRSSKSPLAASTRQSSLAEDLTGSAWAIASESWRIRPLDGPFVPVSAAGVITVDDSTTGAATEDSMIWAEVLAPSILSPLS